MTSQGFTQGASQGSARLNCQQHGLVYFTDSDLLLLANINSFVLTQNVKSLILTDSQEMELFGP